MTEAPYSLNENKKNEIYLISEYNFAQINFFSQVKEHFSSRKLGYLFHFNAYELNRGRHCTFIFLNLNYGEI